MDTHKKVFSSDIQRDQKPLKNDLYDLLNLNPAQPTCIILKDEPFCAFTPNMNKCYIPKKTIKLPKVKTVRDIRNMYEKDILSYLPEDLLKQEKVLFKKIRSGSCRENSTVKLTEHMLNTDIPVSRSTWQMLTNVNPNKYSNSKQFVLWGGKNIRVIGSKGGDRKFLCNYDLGKKKAAVSKTIIKKQTNYKSCLLKTSLNINFKPGPLSRKTELDNSYQKSNVGATELVKLPKIGLEIEPSLGVPVEPTISNILQTLRDDNGRMTEKWAQYAVSTLCSVKNTEVLQNKNDDNSIVFDLSFQHNQNQLLMRRDIKVSPTGVEKLSEINGNNIASVDDVVKQVIYDAIRAVEVSVTEQEFYTESESNNDTRDDLFNLNNTNLNKDKPKKKYSELQKLDVTVITLTDDDENKHTILPCNNSFCALGCVCASLERTFNLRRHCGKIDCMFECKCDFSKYKAFSTLDRQCVDFIPCLLSLDDKINSKLAKEEKKFHQTVVVTEDKSILLKSRRRNLKKPKRYAEYFDKTLTKTEDRKFLSISVLKLDCENILPWCMVHNLYRCFCKGKFVEPVLPEPQIDTGIHAQEQKLKDYSSEQIASSDESSTKQYKQERLKLRANSVKCVSSNTRLRNSSFSDRYNDGFSQNWCSRTKPFEKQKFNFSYYFETNQKIREMEENDRTLHNKLIFHINGVSDDCIEVIELTTPPPPLLLEQSLEQEPHYQMSQEQSLQQTHQEATLLKQASKEDTLLQQTSQTDTSLQKTTHEDTSLQETTQENTLLEMSQEVTLPQQNSQPIENTLQASNISLHNSKVFPNRHKLITWLEANYKHYKERLEKGNNKIPLEAPKPGKIALYPWSVILERYRLKKNYFVVTRDEPYRIFLAVDLNKPFFSNCCNIENVCEEDLIKYPVTITNLLRDVDDMRNNFYIMCGLQDCWELIGSVTKLKDSPAQIKNTGSEIIQEASVIEIDRLKKDESKWFAMIVEDDFVEIQFQSRGFFVKHENIMKAINVARVSGKTVRLSSQKKPNTEFPQFGIYALPVFNETYAFVGPYYKDDALGIETIQTNIHVQNNPKKSRGVWIYLKSEENLKVIENPTLYMPAIDNSSEIIMLNKGDLTLKRKLSSDNELEKGTLTEPLNKVRAIKLVKPIKVKSNGFYNISLLKSPVKDSIETPSVIPTIGTPASCSKNVASENLIIPVIQETFSLSDSATIYGSGLTELKTRPVAEIAPQQKDTIPSLQITNQNKICGMLILKPEEINQKLGHNISLEPFKILPKNTESDGEGDQQLDNDIESFLASSAICSAPNIDDILVVSDDEPDPPKVELPQEVWIECSNIEKLGWIKGRRNKENQLSFEFPGFKFTDFYPEDDAFVKINQVLSRKVYIPKQIIVEWSVVECEENLTGPKLNSDKLGADYVLTKRGLRHKLDLIGNNNKKEATSSPKICKTPSGDVQKLVDISKKLTDNSQPSKV